MIDVTEDPLDVLAESFLARFRRGERPPLEEYTAKHPDLAPRIRELFPALVELEELGSALGPTSNPIRTAVPKRLGEYRIIREIGRGGMGIVYEAVQESLGRQVALKVLPAGPHTPESLLERFRREARLAAKLHHGHIVPVYGVGSDNGVLFYAMQFIDGQGLDAILREILRIRNKSTAVENTPSTAIEGAADDPSASMGQLGRTDYYRNIARLGAQAADALQHAHENGVLHRDIKPSNLILDTKGHLWITDFGLAKADQSDDLTRTGDFLGTLRYMPPERFAGQADARSDIYSLGATLYETIALVAAFPGQDRTHLTQAITHGRFDSLRKHDRTVPRDLENIINKAMALEPAKRYASAEHLADDLRRYSLGEPVRARPPHILERVTRWSRRNPAWATLILVVGVGIVGLAGIISAYNVRLQSALEDAKGHLTQAQSENDRANANLESLRQAIDQFTQLVRDDPNLQSADLAPTRRKLLASAVSFYEKIVQQSGNREDLLFSQAKAHGQLAHLIGIMGRGDDAKAQNLRAIAHYERLIALAPEPPEYYYGLSGCCHNLALAYRTDGDHRQAGQYYQKARQTAEAGLKVAPQYPKLRWFLSKHLDALAIHELEQTNLSAAEHLTQESLAIIESLVAEYPDIGDFRADLINSLSTAGRVAAAQQKSDAAITYLEKGANLGRSLLANSFSTNIPMREAFASVLDYLALEMKRRGQTAEANELTKEAAANWEQLVALRPSRANFSGEMIASYTRLGWIEFEAGRHEQALVYYDRAKSLIQRDKLHESQQRWVRENVAFALRHRGQALVKIGRANDALADFEMALEMGRELDDRRHTYMMYATALANVKRWPEAESAYRQAITTIRQQVTRDPNTAEHDRNLVPAVFQLGEVYLRQYRIEEGVMSFAAAIALRDKVRKGDPKNLREQRLYALVYVDAAMNFSNLGMDTTAMKWIATAWNVIEEFDRSFHDPSFVRQQQTRLLRFRADVWERAGQMEKAQSDRDRAKELQATPAA